MNPWSIYSFYNPTLDLKQIKIGPEYVSGPIGKPRIQATLSQKARGFINTASREKPPTVIAKRCAPAIAGIWVYPK